MKFCFIKSAKVLKKTQFTLNLSENLSQNKPSANKEGSVKNLEIRDQKAIPLHSTSELPLKMYSPLTLVT